ncbi:nitrite reductase [Desulfitobacterium sp. AusDCA]|uniref:nitrite reductase n=1 Tax=Desulfitobacterium sp. AusDCA TaxID=3240383 RepID=UPI003DA70FBB
MGYQGFSKLSAYKAFRQMDNACTPDCQCTAECQLFRAKEYLGLAAQTGEKFSDEIPDDIIEIFRSAPVIIERYNQINLLNAFQEVQGICDNCKTHEHDPFCTVNIVSTALGILLVGKDYSTDKDKEQARLC